MYVGRTIKHLLKNWIYYYIIILKEVVLLLYNTVNKVKGYITNKLLSDINEDGKVNFDDELKLYNVVNSVPGYNIKLCRWIL